MHSLAPTTFGLTERIILTACRQKRLPDPAGGSSHNHEPTYLTKPPKTRCLGDWFQRFGTWQCRWQFITEAPQWSQVMTSMSATFAEEDTPLQ